LLPVEKQLEETDFEELYSREKEMAQLDVMNILYVATTRPTERLYIMCDKPSANRDMKNVPAILWAFLEEKEMWVDGELDYHFGSDKALPTQRKSPEPAMSPNLFITADWRRNIMLSAHSAEHWDLADEGRNLEWGNLVHRVLAKVNTISDLDKVIAGEVISGNLSQERAGELQNLLSAIITSPEIISFFDGSHEVKNEAAIQATSGKEYRPDRIMINNNKAIVMDYKTGKEDPMHQRQIETYGELLAEIGFDNIEKYLLYLDPNYRLVKV
jgi:ATP-dependent exoDNAse (exonuclease V) beta subunit